MLSDAELEHLEQRLLQIRQELLSLQEIGEDATRIVKLDQTSVGRLSRMDALQGQAMSQERARRRQLELQRITTALRRIDTGEYGDCQDCGEPIAVRRLEMDPAATLCIHCAAARER
ncbi:MAG TPA: TraR/DksA C4-type zinc finger protein, partial [Gammaproteobacteria bacterium]|nr:TraR/DksA C4-type zinc finger protein [Gammaproteobacteria bacterium]